MSTEIKIELIALMPDELYDGLCALHEGTFTPGPGGSINLQRFYPNARQAQQALDFLARHETTKRAQS